MKILVECIHGEILMQTMQETSSVKILMQYDTVLWDHHKCSATHKRPLIKAERACEIPLKVTNLLIP